MNRIVSALSAFWLVLAALLAGASPALAQETFNPKSGQLYQLHSNGEIYAFLSELCVTGKCKCQPAQCPAWRKLDFNPSTIQLAPSGSRLYQLHRTGFVYGFKNETCSADACTGWELIDDDPGAAFGALAATNGLAGYALYQLHMNGSVWRLRNPKACDGTNCPGWRNVIFLPNTTQIAATSDMVGDILFVREANGNVWRVNGWSCVGDRCDPPMLIDRTQSMTIAAAKGEAYQVRRNGTVWRATGLPCEAKSCAKAWEQYDNRFASQIVATDKGLYQRRSNGEILFNKGVPCKSANTCTGWTSLDRNSGTVEIAASPWGLYQRHANGALWRYTGQPCTFNACNGWEMIDRNSRTQAIFAAN